MVNFGTHPDSVGGEYISADYIGYVCATVESSLSGTKCIFLQGPQGDVNHVNVHPTGGFFNGMFNDFDDVSRGYAHAEYIARVVTAGVLQAFDKVKYVDVNSLTAMQKQVFLPSNKPTPEQVVEAKRIYDLHLAGKDDEIPFKGMMLTTVLAESRMRVTWQNAPEAFEVPLFGMAIGPVALIGIPGEPFTEIGVQIKTAEGYDMIMPCALTNGYEGYFPVESAYAEGGYEARTSPFKAGVADAIVNRAKEMLKELKK
jgi:hypothetical protein